MKRNSILFALALMISLCCGQWSFAHTPPGNDSESVAENTFTVTIAGVDYVANIVSFDDLDAATCQKLQCGQSVAPQVTLQYYVPCPNDPALAGPLANWVAQQFADNYCSRGLYCCPFGSLCNIDCGPENVTWVCNDPAGILYVTFDMKSECTAPTRP